MIASLLHGWRRSLQLRVVTTTVVLSALVVALVGALLLDQIVDGILEAKQRAAVAEAYGGFATAQTLLNTQGADGASVGLLLGQVARDLSTRSTRGAEFEIVVLGSDAQPEQAQQFNPRASGLVEAESVPLDLRRAVAENEDPQVTYRTISYSNDVTERGFMVGRRLATAGAGFYEMYYLFPLAQERQTLALVQRTLFTAGGLLLILIGVIAWFVVRQTVTPVRMAARVAERLSAGELQERLEVRGEDDMARLALSFNEMAESLQQQIHKLEELSRMQRRFVSDVSHELRTPLTTVRMAADVLHEARGHFDRDAARSAELLQRELNRFEELLGELLEISRFDAGAAALEAEPFDIRDLVRRVAADTQSLSERTGSEVVLWLPAYGCIADVDARRVDRILRNLVVNALEHGEGRPVEIVVAADEAAVAVAVRDHGVGLRPGEAGQVFNRFWRADPARARTSGGTGLGLSIAQEDTRLHNGWLQAWGRPDTGSVFRMTLPRKSGDKVESSPLPLVPPDARRAHDAHPALSTGADPRDETGSGEPLRVGRPSHGPVNGV